MNYIDGFVAAVSNRNKDRYIEHARQAALVFREYGALQVVETWGDDIPDGEQTSFPMAVQCADDETVVFSWIVWPSRDARESGMQKAMSDPRLSDEQNPMPFDGQRLIYGGFQVVVEE